MRSISNAIPITAAPFKFLEKANRNVFVINPNDKCLVQGLKVSANIARKAVIVLAMAIVALVSPLLLLADLVRHGVRLCGKQTKPSVAPTSTPATTPTPTPAVSVSAHPVHNPIQAQKLDFHFLYTSEIFSEYLDKLKSCIEAQLKLKPLMKLQAGACNPKILQAVANFIDLIRTATSSDEDSNRKLHQEIVLQLRDLVHRKQQENKNFSPLFSTYEFIEKISEFVYVGTNMMSSIERFIEQHLPLEAQQELQTIQVIEIPAWLKKWHTTLDKMPKFNGIFETVPPRLYDPRELGDLPTILFQYPLSKKNVTIIRTPTVVRDLERGIAQAGVPGKIIKAEVVNEFRGFLDSYKKQNKVHLYVNLMERISGTSESARTQQIEMMEKEYPNNLRVITLAKNSEFYFQNGSFTIASMPFSEFKDLFIKEMFNKPTTFRWPAVHNGQAWIDRCTKIIDSVHSKQFGQRTDLSYNERKDFIEIAYTEFVEAALEDLQPDSSNISCLSCIDRAAAMLTELFVKVCKKQGNDLNPAQRKQLTAIALAPAILAQNRLMQVYRMDRLHTAAERMLA